MNRNKKGFTLVELLAVIIILAALVVITAPIVINITEKSEDETLLLAANMYLDAVKQATMNKNLEEKGTFDPTLCEVNEGGSLICDGATVDLEVNGQLPSSGTIKLKNHNITSVKLNYGENTIIKSKSGELINFENEYKIGQKVTFIADVYNNSIDGYIIDENEDTVTILTYTYSGSYWSNKDGDLGPIILLDNLNSLTSNWIYVDPIENYRYNNNEEGRKNFGYQKVEIKNGTTKIISEDGTEVNSMPGIAKSRLLTLEEIFEISASLNSNLTLKNLIAYIEENLEAIKSRHSIDDSVYTVDELLTALKTKGFDYRDYYTNLYSIVLDAKSNGIKSDYDMSLASWLCKGHYFASWILTSFKIDNMYALSLTSDCEILPLSSNSDAGVRPVVTISKDKIK